MGECARRARRRRHHWILRLKAQVICKHFSPETIVEMSAAQQAEMRRIVSTLQLDGAGV